MRARASFTNSLNRSANSWMRFACLRLMASVGNQFGADARWRWHQNDEILGRLLIHAARRDQWNLGQRSRSAP